jgi:hypothetical protein
MLTDNLRLVRDISKRYQEDLVAKRAENGPGPLQNKYQPGDFVLFELDKLHPRASKLSSPFSGPFEVLYQKDNDVTCRHLSDKVVKIFHVERLKLFAGSKENAEKAAMLDSDQYIIDQFLGYKGVHTKRLTLEFKIRFLDGDERWLPWSKDITETVQFQHFCESRPHLVPLLVSAHKANKELTEIRTRPITMIQPGEEVYTSLQFFGDQWFQELDLPDWDFKDYVVRMRYDQFRDRSHMRIRVYCVSLDECLRDWDSVDVNKWGLRRTLKEDMILVTDGLIHHYPTLIDAKKLPAWQRTHPKV